jgi:hypothetical protein
LSLAELMSVWQDDDGYGTALSRKIVQHENEWGLPMSEWNTLDALMKEQGQPDLSGTWEVEKKRIESLRWWDQVQGKVEGFPPSIVAHNLHPVGVIGNFIGLKRHPKIVLDGVTIELEFLDIWDEEPIPDSAYIDAANELGCEVAVIKAIARQESSHSPYRKLGAGWDWVPTLQYERHYFSRLTNHQYNSTHPDISATNGYGAGGYGAYSNAWRRLLKAYALDKRAALMACSWGQFQVMGENAAVPGFTFFSVEEMVRAIGESHSNHLKSFVGFVKTKGGTHQGLTLLQGLRQKNWVVIAYLYNGANYIQNNYHTGIQNHYNAIVATNS